MISTGTGLGAALISCVIPFLPGDAETGAYLDL